MRAIPVLAVLLAASPGLAQGSPPALAAPAQPAQPARPVAQAQVPPAELVALHQRVRLDGLENRKFSPEQFWDVAGPVLDGSPALERREIGRSAEGRPLFLVRFGAGPVSVLLWSQMHGDESTATMALGDIFNFLAESPEHPLARRLAERLTLLFIPVLNPDGADRFIRRNAQGIDVNRDARVLATPEGRALKAVRDSFAPDYGFNLHDQNIRVRAGRSDRLAAIALLAPAYDEARSYNEVRNRARRVASVFGQAVEPLVEGHITRYGDAFNPRAFGDLVQQWGTSTVLVESGGWADDPQKQYLRQVNFVGLLSALDAIATGQVAQADMGWYDALPANGATVSDLLVRGGTLVLPGIASFDADFLVNFSDPLERTGGRLTDVGDLEGSAARDTLDAAGLFLHFGGPGAPAGARPAQIEPGMSASFVARRGAEPAAEAVWVVDDGVVRAAQAANTRPAGGTAQAQPRAWPAQNRPDVSGLNGAVVADHPLAVAAGHDVLRRGGNAVDAAVTMAAVLAVVRPHMNGVGGDAFALFYDGRSGQVTGLNASGRAGELASPEFFRSRGMRSIPSSGGASITVPGAVSAWAAALERYGTISLADALAPAIQLAEDGWVVTATLSRDIRSSVLRLNEGGRAILAPGGSLPPVGGVLRNQPLAATLREIASGGSDAFYRGRIAETLARFIQAEGGYLRPSDFHAHRPEWVEPISIVLHGGRRVHAMPPNSQGLAQLQQLAMAESFDLASFGHNSAQYLHTLIEVKRLAFADRDRWVADPNMAALPLDRLLDRDYLRDRAALVGAHAAAEVRPGIGNALTGEQADGEGDTVYLMAMDRFGNGVSWIQSIFASFGSRLVEPETGIVLQNRGSGFVLDEAHPNVIAPGKRPFHTLTPMLVTDTEGLRMTIGTPGGHGQSQFLTQVYHNVFSFGMGPQRAVEAPRFIHSGNSSQIEDRVPAEVFAALRQRGHDVRPGSGWTASFGGVQVILRDPASGALRTGADPRREAYGIAF